MTRARQYLPTVNLDAALARSAIAKATRERFENLLDFQLKAAGVDSFERQYRFIEGRKFSADFAWPRYRLAVEVQGGIWRKGGGAHSHPTMIERDIEKIQVGLTNGWAILPVTSDQVKRGEALRVIMAVIDQRAVNASP